MRILVPGTSYFFARMQQRFPKNLYTAFLDFNLRSTPRISQLPCNFRGRNCPGVYIWPKRQLAARPPRQSLTLDSSRPQLLMSVITCH